jgi:glycosyltransferase involved in cell wall biosynthesis
MATFLLTSMPYLSHVQISAVIIASSEERTITQCVLALLPCCAEVLVLVNNTTDATAALAEAAGARVVACDWRGYGATKNYGHTLAKNDWILSVDADEVVDNALCEAITKFQFNEHSVGVITRLLIWNGKVQHYGAGREKKARLFNRNMTKWNQSLAHEALEYEQTPNYVELNGFLLHDAYSSKQQAVAQLDKYAALMAKQRGGKSSTLNAAMHGIFSFIKLYFLKLGFLDGASGLELAQLYARYTYKKYAMPITNTA